MWYSSKNIGYDFINKLIECDGNIFHNSTLSITNLLQKNGVPWLLTALHNIKAWNALDLIQSICTSLHKRKMFFSQDWLNEVYWLAIPISLTSKCRNSRSHMFFKIGVVENFVTFTGKYLCRSLFLIKFQAWTPVSLLTRDSNAGVFLWILRNF